MERGLLWLPLLITFFWLAWLGTREYQKIEVYQEWAKEFDQAKYDIYSVLGYKEKMITWGKPSHKKMVNLESFSLGDIKTISLLVNNQVIPNRNLPKKGKPFIQLEFENSAKIVKIPFTEIDLAAKWTEFLIKQKTITN